MMRRTKKIMLLFLVCMTAFALAATGCGKAEAPEAKSASEDFLLTASVDVVFDLDTKGEVLDSVAINGTALESSDYAFANGKLTLKNAYLTTLTVGSHIFTCTTAGGSCKVTVRVSAGTPAVTPAKVKYDYSNPADAVFTVNLAGGTVKGVTFGDIVLTEEDYSLSGNQFSIKQAFIDANLLENVENTLVLTSEGGVITLVIETFDSAPIFDETLVKYQSAEGKDVSFSLSTGTETTRIVSLTCDGRTLDSTDYAYADGRLTVKSDCLAAETVGLHAFRVLLSDKASTSFDFWIGAFGSAEGTHLLPDNGALNNFESYEAGRSVNLANTLMNIPPEVVADGIDGKSLRLTISSEDIHCIFSGQRTFAANKVYCFKMKLKIDPMCKIIFNWGSGTDFCEINADGTIKYSLDSRNKIKKGDDGVFDIELYSAYTATSNKFEIYVGTGSGKTTVLFDDLMILETALPVSSPAAPNLEDQVFYDDDVVFTDVKIPAGASFGGIYQGETALRSDTEAVFDAAQKTLTIKKEYLTGKNFPLALTLRIEAASDYLGGTTSFGSSFRIVEKDNLAAERSMIEYHSEFFSGIVVDTAKAFPGVTFSGVTSVKLADADVAFAFDPETKKLTLEKSVLTGIADGGHCFKITPKDGTVVDFHVFKNVQGAKVFDYDFEDPGVKPPYTDPINKGTAAIEGGQYVIRPDSNATEYFSTLGAFTLDAGKTYQLKLRFRADASRAFSFKFDGGSSGAFNVLEVNFAAGVANVIGSEGKVRGFVNKFADNVYDVTIFLTGTDNGKAEIWCQDKSSAECVHRFDEISLYEANNYIV